jgi:hypothetical protein
MLAAIRNSKIMIDLDKQKYPSWHYIDDLEIGCYCGESFQIPKLELDESIRIKCENCGQEFMVYLNIIPIRIIS